MPRSVGFLWWALMVVFTAAAAALFVSCLTALFHGEWGQAVWGGLFALVIGTPIAREWPHWRNVTFP